MISSTDFDPSVWVAFFGVLGLASETINQRGSEFIDGVALEEYADEQDDYAQEREIEACIKAVDVDCDGKIGTYIHVCVCHG